MKIIFKTIFYGGLLAALNMPGFTLASDMTVVGNGSSVTINGKTYSGRSISINGDNVVVDGVRQTGNLTGPINVVVNGNAESVETASGKVQIMGSAGKIKTMSGDVRSSNVLGDVSTMSGDISCKGVAGNSHSMSGDIE